MPKRPEVEQWLAGYNKPLKPLLLALRDIILAADPRIDECIKWQTPTFTFNGNLASFNPRSKKHVSLMFHVGAMIPGSHPKLEGTGDSARFMSFPDLAAVQSSKRDLARIVRAWCDWQDARTPRRTREASAKKPTKKKVAARRTTTTSSRQAVAAKQAKKPAAKKPTAISRTTASRAAAASRPAAKRAPARRTSKSA
jgi:uncharacterized protein YdhG (YjbR/CyaY superfamily)